MAETASKPWVDGPFELISSSLVGAKKGGAMTGTQNLASEMALVHNALLRGINAVYLQAANVCTRGTPKDQLDFANFALRWGRMIDEHHEVEEELIFPAMNDICGVPGLMDANVGEHEAFHTGLVEYLAYLEKVTKGEEALDGEKLRSLIDSFGGVLREHLKNEIITLKDLSKYEDKTDWSKWFKGITDTLVSKQMKTAEFRNEMFALPFLLHDKTFEDGVWSNFPPVPWVVGIVLRWVFFKWHDDWWRFAGCGYDSTPRELPFA